MKQSSRGSTRVFQALTPLPDSTTDEFSILSFNILTKAFDNKTYYQYVNHVHRLWSYRYPKIKEIILNYCTDIICLQECDPFTFQKEFGDIYKQQHNYSFIIDTKDTKKNKYKNDKNAAELIIKPATLYKTDKFKLIYNEFRSRGIISLFEVLKSEDINTDECKQERLHKNASYVFIVNVHLEGEPKKWSIRFKQIKSVLDRITFRCGEYDIDPLKVPIVICGDFNDGILSSIHKTLIEGGLDKNWYDTRFGEMWKRNEKDSKQDYKHLFTFSDSYDVVFKDSLQFRPPTFAANGRRAIVDFIYYTSNNLKCFGVSQPLPAFMTYDTDSLLLPNQNWISDHLPIAGLYQITSTNMILDAKKNKNGKKNKNKKKQKNKQIRKQKTHEWVVHEMTSF